MNIALTEMKRSWGRFILLTASVVLLVFLILFQQAIEDGLITAFIGAIRNQSAPVVVYSLEGQRTLQASFLTDAQRKQIEEIDGVGRTARVQQSTYSVNVHRAGASGSETDSTVGAGSGLDDVSIIGSSDSRLFFPTSLSEGRRPVAVGEAIGSAGDFDLGDRVEVPPSPNGTTSELTVVGLADDVQLYVTATLFTGIETSTNVARAFNPATPTGVTNAVAVEPTPGTDPGALARLINDKVADVEALTRTEAANGAPGVAQVRQSFQMIFLLYALVVPLVTGMFFLILTLQKASALTLLRAMGARPAFLATTLLTQVLIVLTLGVALATALFYPLSQGGLDGLLRFNARAVATWAVVLVVLGMLSTIVSLRRISRIDPIRAAVGGSDI